jgi:hypothetical protein
MTSLSPVNSQVPVAVSIMDGTSGSQWATPLQIQELNPVAPIPYGANATVINSNGTSTINSGGGLYYGCSAIGLGTLWTVAVFDVVGTSSKTLATSISVAALGALALAGPAGVGIKYLGNLITVTAGTLAGTLNVLWD